jgi:hypothetical protein
MPSSMSVVFIARDATEAEAEDWEHAMRWVAHCKGFKVYALPPGLFITQMGRQMTWRRRWLAWKISGKVKRVLKGAV